MPDPEEQHSRRTGENQRIVDVLRETFAAARTRLTPEVEAATIYLPYARVSDANSPVENTE
jgi:hypothetical protein